MSIVKTPYGFPQQKVHGRLMNRTGGMLTRGEIVMVDHASSSSEATEAGFSQTGNDGNAITPATAGLGYRYFAVLLDETCADDTVGNFAIVDDDVEAWIIKGSGSVNVGDALQPANSSTDLSANTAGAGVKYIAIALEAVTTPSTHLRGRVKFNGMYGFGSYAAS